MSNWKIADELDAESAEGVLRDDIKWLKRYVRQCTVLAPLFAGLSEPLETPLLATYAQRIERRVSDMSFLGSQAASALAMLERFEREFAELIEHLASGQRFSIEDLPAYISLAGLGSRIEEVRVQVAHEDERGHIEWQLEDYIGPGSRVYARIERLQPGDPSIDAGELQLDLAIYGVLKYHSDPDYIAERIEEARAE